MLQLMFRARVTEMEMTRKFANHILLCALIWVICAVHAQSQDQELVHRAVYCLAVKDFFRRPKLQRGHSATCAHKQRDADASGQQRLDRGSAFESIYQLRGSTQ